MGVHVESSPRRRSQGRVCEDSSRSVAKRNNPERTRKESTTTKLPSRQHPQNVIIEASTPAHGGNVDCTHAGTRSEAPTSATRRPLPAFVGSALPVPVQVQPRKVQKIVLTPTKTLSNQHANTRNCITNTASMLYLVGLGLADEKDITVRGLEIVKKAERVYLEAYTAVLLVDKEALVSCTCMYKELDGDSADQAAVGVVLWAVCSDCRPRDGRVVFGRYPRRCG